MTIYMDLEKYRQIFLDETTEELNSLESLILTIEKDPPDSEAIKSIFRLFHRLKSSSAMMGLSHFSELSHHAEDLLSLIKDGELDIGTFAAGILLSVVDTLRHLLREAGSGNVKGTRPEELLVRLKEICSGISINETLMSRGLTKEDENPPSLNPLPFKGRDRVGMGLFSDEKGADLQTAQIHHGLNVIRIDEAELNDLIDMAGELISTLSELDKITYFLNGISSIKEMEIANQSITGIKCKAEKLSLGIHTQLLRSKMVPAGEVFERLKRVIHDLSVKTNKCVQVLINGSEIELDRAIADKLFNPLLHIVRNAVDHGIEGEEDRLKNGKSPVSTITLAASLEGHYVTISVEDDGKGIDLERVKKEILKRGILNEKGIENLTEKEIMDYLFLPGFSTKEEATDISGRGMGLDIVRGNVKELKGEVDITTIKGKGTDVKITIPQTLTIIRSLQVFIGHETYSIPTESIVEIIPYDPGAFMTIQERPLLLYRGSPVPVADLYGILHIHHKKDSITSHVIIGNSNLRVAIPVSDVIGEQDLLLKHLGRSFSHVVGLLGVGILGGGKLSLIIDTDFLLRQYQRDFIYETANSQ